MKEAIILTREEYREFYDSFQRIKAEKESANTVCELLKDVIKDKDERIKELWEALNRPAIDASVEAHHKEELAWCEKIAKKYEAKDEEEWMTQRAKFYNNGIYEFCKENNVSEEEAYAHRQYYDKCKFWSNVTIMNECDAQELEYLQTEGWTQLSEVHHGLTQSFVLPNAADEVFHENYVIGKGWKSKKARHLWEVFHEMEEDCKSITNNSWSEYCR